MFEITTTHISVFEEPTHPGTVYYTKYLRRNEMKRGSAAYFLKSNEYLILRLQQAYCSRLKRKEAILNLQLTSQQLDALRAGNDEEYESDEFNELNALLKKGRILHKEMGEMLDRFDRDFEREKKASEHYNIEATTSRDAYSGQMANQSKCNNEITTCEQTRAEQISSSPNDEIIVCGIPNPALEEGVFRSMRNAARWPRVQKDANRKRVAQLMKLPPRNTERSLQRNFRKKLSPRGHF